MNSTVIFVLEPTNCTIEDPGTDIITIQNLVGSLDRQSSWNSGKCSMGLKIKCVSRDPWISRKIRGIPMGCRLRAG